MGNAFYLDFRELRQYLGARANEAETARRALIARARDGDAEAGEFLRRQYGCRVWTREEIRAEEQRRSAVRRYRNGADR